MKKILILTFTTLLFSKDCVVDINLKAEDKSKTVLNIINKKECIINLNIEDLSKAKEIKKAKKLVKKENKTFRILKTAKSKIGSKYKYRAKGPNRFDCSGFVNYVFKENSINIPRTSKLQSQIDGKKLKRDEIKKGDILFFDTAKRGYVNHSGIYLGDGKFIHSSSGKAYSVTISSLNGWYKDKFLWGKRVKSTLK